MLSEPLEPLNIHQLLVNPTGKYTSFMASRARIIQDLESRYYKMLKRAKTFHFRAYKKKDNYIFVFSIPSETFPDNLFYDVIIKFISNDETKKERTIKNYTLELFSNSPAFTFTYTYVLNKNKMIVDFMKNKCSHNALTMQPVVKNPVEIYGFEKSCYFACKFLVDYNLLSKLEINNNLYLFNQTSLKSKIASQESKLKEYNLLKYKKKKTKKKSKVTNNNDTVTTFKTKALKKGSTIKAKKQPKKPVAKKKKK